MSESSDICLEAGRRWWRDRCPGMGAAISFFAILAAPTFVVLLLTILTKLVGEEEFQSAVLPFLKDRFESRAVQLIHYLVMSVDHFSWSNLSVGIVGIIALALGAGGFTGQVKDSLETIWGKRMAEVSIWEFLRDQVTAGFFAFVFALAGVFSIMVRFLFRSWLGLEFQPEGWEGVFLNFANHLFMGIIITAVSAVLYKLIPRFPVRWRDVFPGALCTGALMIVGRFAVGRYLNRHDVEGLTGIGGDILIFLVWTFYYSQIFLFGAEMTRVLYDRRHPGVVVERLIA